MRLPKDLEASLIALVQGHRDAYFCTRATSPIDCSLHLMGTVDGYPVLVAVGPAVYDAGKQPAGAQRVVIGNKPSDLYVYGTQVFIGLNQEG